MSHRKGNICVLTAFLILVMLVLFSLAVDLGYICLVRTQLQAAADSASLAGAATLYPISEPIAVDVYDLNAGMFDARDEAQKFASYNIAAQHRGTLTVDLNLLNDDDGDIVLGNWNKVTREFESSESNPMAVRVRVPMTPQHANGRVKLLFGFVERFAETQAVATAVVCYPMLLPFSTSVSKWESVVDDDEFTVFPEDIWKDTNGLPPGNFGALSFGEGTSDLRYQIAYGVTLEDLIDHGGVLHDGLIISGETGIKLAWSPP